MSEREKVGLEKRENKEKEGPKSCAMTELNSPPFRAAFSGIDRVLSPPGDGAFFDFFDTNFYGHAFRLGQ